MGSRRIWGIVAGVVIPVLAVVAILIIRIKLENRKIDFGDYVDIEVAGVNNHAYADFSVDNVILCSKLTKYSGEEFDTCMEFVESLKWDINKESGIANGDVIKVSASYDEEWAKEHKVRIDGTVKEITVGNLSEGTRLDAFADIKIIISGTSPHVYLSYVNETDNAYIAKLEYYFDRNDGLSAGDEFTITCRVDERNASINGYYFEQLSMTGSITDVDRYALDYHDIPAEVIDAIAAADMEYITDEVGDTTYHMSYRITNDKKYLYRDGHEALERIERAGVRLFVNDTGDELDTENYLVMIYKGSIAMPLYNGAADPYEHLGVYFAVIYPDVIIGCDGNTVWDETILIGSTGLDGIDARLSELIGDNYRYAEMQDTGEE